MLGVLQFFEIPLVRHLFAFYYHMFGRGWFYMFLGLQCLPSMTAESEAWLYMNHIIIIMGGLYCVFWYLGGLEFAAPLLVRVLR